MMDQAETTKRVRQEIERTAAQRARDRAGVAMWNLNIVVLMFGVLTIVIILLFREVAIEIVATIAILGLAMSWLLGWRRGRRLYERFYDEELSKLEGELEKTVKAVVKEVVEETIEEQVQKALRERRR